MTQHSLTRNNVQVKGSGKQPMIFAPGFGFDQTIWYPVLKSFENDYQVISFDYVGFGGSDISAYDSDKYNQISGYVDDLLEICSDLDLHNAIFIGHSVGSMIGMLASIKKPELLSKMIMIGPSPCFINEPPHYHGGFEKDDLINLLEMMDKNYTSWVNSISKTIINDDAKPEMAQDIEERFSLNEPNITRTFAEVCFFTDYREYLSNVMTPSLIIHSSNDVFVPDVVADYMKENIPFSSVIHANTVGHCPHMSHPEETIELIKDFLHKQETRLNTNSGEL
ncbi:alpha/beta hydrolase [Aquibacillus koreensis]|uniref:Alpha/beta hydrolase n=1 Tax=Aquibacillus koreensis TaxID=279446 RepID=A0A9X3WN62_9BACI|nr:alpha/beta hydrolase [Aquibacillus koreensis]MCT2536949.1 alpha/beta hydrolase [Aquibacillus koreensis]MDC3421920.1 alpha/beta hydrolase [Aquibacillus koreensis]